MTTPARARTRTATATNPVIYVPGPLTPVTIAGPTGSTYEVISGGGAAASVGLTGNVSLAGSYAIVGGVSTVVPVDVVIRGCPPTPKQLLAGLLSLLTR